MEKFRKVGVIHKITQVSVAQPEGKWPNSLASSTSRRTEASAHPVGSLGVPNCVEQPVRTYHGIVRSGEVWDTVIALLKTVSKRCEINPVKIFEITDR